MEVGKGEREKKTSGSEVVLRTSAVTLTKKKGGTRSRVMSSLDHCGARAAAQEHRDHARWHTTKARNLDDNIDHLEACGFPPDYSDKPLAAAQEHRDCAEWHRKRVCDFTKYAGLFQQCDKISYDDCDHLREAYAEFHGTIFDKMRDGHCARK